MILRLVPYIPLARPGQSIIYGLLLIRRAYLDGSGRISFLESTVIITPNVTKPFVICKQNPVQANQFDRTHA